MKENNAPCWSASSCIINKDNPKREYFLPTSIIVASFNFTSFLQSVLEQIKRLQVFLPRIDFLAEAKKKGLNASETATLSRARIIAASAPVRRRLSLSVSFSSAPKFSLITHPGEQLAFNPLPCSAASDHLRWFPVDSNLRKKK